MSDSKIRFVRWQQVQIVQMGVVNQAVLALATAGLGFALSEVPSLVPLCAVLGSSLLFLASIGLAVWCAWNRLADFRETAQIANLDQSGSGGRNLCARRYHNDLRGQRSWTLIRWQLGTFAFGAAVLTSGFLVAYLPLANR